VSIRAKARTIFWKWGAPLLGAAALALAVFFYFHSPREHRYRLRLTAGSKVGMRHRLAQLLQAEVARQGIDLELYETHGSEDALDRVNDRRLDAALVTGGLRSTGRPDVREVMPLHMEALHLLVKQEHYPAVARHLTALEGKTVNLSEADSGTHSLAIDVLAFVGLHPRSADRPRGYVPVELSRQQLLEEQGPARLPDAVLLVSSLPSPVAKHLVHRHGYRLVPLPFGEAFALESLAPEPPNPSERLPPAHVDKGHTYSTVIPAFTCSVEPPVPPEPVPTVGTRLLLVAHKDVPPQAVRRLLEATLASKVAKSDRPPIDANILKLPPEFPWHDGTTLYRERNQPVVSGALVDSAHKGMAIFAAAVSGLFVLWQWIRQRRHFLRDHGFNYYLHQVSRIEEEAEQAERGRPTDPERWRELRARLGRLKAEALHRFTQGELTDAELLAAFLTQVNGARDYLERQPPRQEGQGELAPEENVPPLTPLALIPPARK
jgi:TRAP-type uncharacterized transport system substrate-binding protein